MKETREEMISRLLDELIEEHKNMACKDGVCTLDDVDEKMMERFLARIRKEKKELNDLGEEEY